MGTVLASIAAFTLVISSIIALRQDNLKRRLAFSTVSQLSYIVLGLAVLNPMSITGGLLHIPAHAFMKLTLFFCAGAIHVETHTDDINDMAGIGARMPLTMTAFGVAALGMAGIPLIAGFVSKYFLLIGTVTAGDLAFTGALLASGILNVAYFWPIVYTAFFESYGDSDSKPVVEGPLGSRLADAADDTDIATDGGNVDDATDEHDAPIDGEHDDQGYAADYTGEEGTDHREPHHGDWESRDWRGGESTWFMLGPILFAASGSVVLGIVPDTAVFLRIVRLIVAATTGVNV